MAWVESHEDVWEHHRTLRLMQLLKISDVEAVGHLHSLWHFVLRNAWEDADLSPWGDSGVELAARWRGAPGAFVQALREVGCLEGFVVHGWMRRCGELVKERFRNKNRRNKRVNQESTGDLPGIDRDFTTTTVPYRTVPNPTESGETQRTSSAASPAGSPPPALVFPVVGRGAKEWGLPAAKLAEYAEAYPGVDVAAACRQAKQWCVDNPARRKTAAGMPRFLAAWLAREQNRGGVHGRANGGGNRGAGARIVGGAAPVPGKYDGVEHRGG